MKILMITMSMGIGGAETHILELSKGLSARGNEIHVASAGGVFVKELVKAGISHFTLPLDRREIFAMLKAKKGLEMLIRNGNYDIVHAHARIPAFLCGKIREKIDFRFVTTDHLDFELTPLLRKLTNWGEWTFAVSEDLKKYLLQNFKLNPDHISLTVNGVDTARFSPEKGGEELRKAWKTQDHAVVLHISRLDEPVTVCASALMDAMEKLDGNAQLVIVGDGDHAEILRQKGQTINEKLGYPAVIFAGATSDVKPYILASDIVVAPSRAAMEGMSCGRPTIISGSQGHGGIFSEKLEAEARKSNLCFRGADLPNADVLAHEISEILSMNEKEREALGASCRAFIQTYYSVDIMVESQLAVYERLAPYPTGGDPDVLLCGYYGYGNLGDETLLSVIIRKLRERLPSIRICVLSATPKETAAYHMVDAVNRFDLAEIKRKMKKSKLFLFGGGSLLQDKTSNRSLSYYLHMLRMAKQNGMKIAVFANGIGPILQEKNEKRVKDALMLADRLSFRDEASLEFAKKHCEGKAIHLAFDPAILMETSDFCAPREDFFVVIPKKTAPDSAETLKKAVLWTQKTYRLRPVFVSLFEAEDKDYTENLANALGAEALSFTNAEDCMAYLSRARFLISARLHGLVYATAAKCPMLAFSDDIKLISYMGTIGFGYPNLIPLYYNVIDSETWLFERLEGLLAHEDEIRARLSEKLPDWRASAAAEFDEIIRLLNET